MTAGSRRHGIAAPVALPVGCAALLLIGGIAAGTHGALTASWVLALAAVVVICGSFVAEPAVAPWLGVIGWLAVTGFSRPPYAQLRMTGPTAVRAAAVLGACCLGGVVAGAIVRRLASSFTLWIVDVPEERWPLDDPEAAGLPPDPATPGPGRARWLWRAHRPEGPPRRWARDLTGGIGGRRLLAGVMLVAGLPLLTAALVAGQRHLGLADDLLIYLVAVVVVAVVGGFWPAVLAAVTSSVLLNWYFTRPVHTLTIADPQNLLALLLFITVAVTVSSVVHLAAHRAQQAARSGEEAARLLTLAQTVLGGADTPAAVLDHLTGSCGGRAELAEQTGGQWIRVAVSGTAPEDAAVTRVQARPGLALIVSGQSRPVTARLLDGFAAQAAAALDRDRLRTQAAQAEALAEGNRMRTALLAAVSHDLRTPLASIKASVSTLRQTDVQWTPADEAALLATIEQGADRLDALIGNLLDMSRLSTGSLQPFLRPTAIDEVAPVALRGLDAGGRVQLAVPDGLPLVRTDPGLLERVLANLFANALAYSPPQPAAGTAGQPCGRQRGPGHHRSWPRGARRAQVADVRAVRAAGREEHRHRRRPGAGGGQGLPGHHGRLGDRGRHSRRRADHPGQAAGGQQAGQCSRGSRPVTRVLVIDDEAPILRALKINLTARQYEVSTAADGASGLEAMARDRPDVLILDLGLPDMDGTEVIRGVRGWTSTPIIVLSAWGQESQKVAALDAGADDYVTKPFGMDELLARLRAAVRRASPAPDEPVVAAGDFTVDLAAKRVTRGGHDVRLTPTEWQLLEVLVRNSGRLVSQRQLLHEVWGPGYETEGNYLRVFVAQLRRKLESDPSRPRYLLTEAGMGYRFQP